MKKPVTRDKIKELIAAVADKEGDRPMVIYFSAKDIVEAKHNEIIDGVRISITDEMQEGKVHIVHKPYNKVDSNNPTLIV